MYRLKPREATLEFKGDYEGAEVVVTLDHPLKLYIEAQKMHQSQDIQAMCHLVSDILLRWNVEDAKGKLPTTYAGVVRAYPAFINTIIAQWMEAQVTLETPLGKD